MAAIDIWKKKLAFLEEQRGIASDGAIQFTLDQQIEECKKKIEELEGDPIIDSPRPPVTGTPNFLKIRVTSKTVYLNYNNTEYISRNRLEDFKESLLSSEINPSEYGEILFKAIFNDEPNLAVQGYDSTLTGYRASEKIPLKVKLEIDANDIKLHEYDWELLKDPRKDNYWLSLQKDRPFYRRHGNIQKDSIKSKPLNVLIVICNPKIENNTIIEKLSPVEVDEEIQHLKYIFDELREDNIKYNILERGTWNNLKDALQKNTYNVVHLIAHGTYIDDKFCLMMDGENRNECFIDKDKFDQDLSFSNLQLFVLISCQGGSFNKKLNTKGLGPILVDKGVPYVVAMQKPISFDEARKFSQLFYPHLIHYRAIDKAMASTRSDMKGDHSLNQTNNPWAIPVLFMGKDNGDIFTGT